MTGKIILLTPPEPRPKKPAPLTPEVAEAVDAFWRWLAEQPRLRVVGKTTP